MKFYIYYDDGNGFKLLDFDAKKTIKLFKNKEKGFKGIEVNGAAITNEGELMFFEVKTNMWITYTDHEDMSLKIKYRLTKK